jgi:hypothetical protein
VLIEGGDLATPAAAAAAAGCLIKVVPMSWGKPQLRKGPVLAFIPSARRFPVKERLSEGSCARARSRAKAASAANSLSRRGRLANLAEALPLGKTEERLGKLCRGKRASNWEVGIPAKGLVDSSANISDDPDARL